MLDQFTVLQPDVTGLRWEDSAGNLKTTVEAGQTVYAEVTGTRLSGTVELQVHEEDLGIRWDTGKRIYVPVSSTGGRVAWTADWDLDPWPAASADPEYMLYYAAEGDVSGSLQVTDNTAPYAPSGLAVSDDLMAWERVGDGPVIAAADRFESAWRGRAVRWRLVADPHVYPETFDGWHFAFLNAQDVHAPVQTGGCVAMMRSGDLLSWEPHAVAGVAVRLGSSVPALDSLGYQARAGSFAG